MTEYLQSPPVRTKAEYVVKFNGPERNSSRVKIHDTDVEKGFFQYIIQSILLCRPLLYRTRISQRNHLMLTIHPLVMMVIKIF